MADTALRTATAGYLTRRLVDVAQDVVVREADCRDKEGAYLYREDSDVVGISFASRLRGRVLVEDVSDSAGKAIAKKGEAISKEKALEIEKKGVYKVKIRSVVTCKTRRGICQTCYGLDLGRNELVQIGQAVGIVAAQAIGEPGTQLTMRTFHIGGVAGTDITQGLPRVDEIFEARPPKGEAAVCEIDGRVAKIEETEKEKIMRIEQEGTKKKKETREYVVPGVMSLSVKEGELVARGQVLSEGHIDLKKLFKIEGRDAVHRYVIKEVQEIYSAQGEGINDKHIEIIIRQMLSLVRILDPGDTDLLPGDIVDEVQFLEANEVAKKQKKNVATAERLLLGISKVALSTESFLSAASFQETAKVLINAAVTGKEDKLRGLKENVIIGKLIPAGTGFRE